MLELRERKHRPKFGKSSGRFDKKPEPKKRGREPLEFTLIMRRILPIGIGGGIIYYFVLSLIG